VFNFAPASGGCIGAADHQRKDDRHGRQENRGGLCLFPAQHVLDAAFGIAFAKCQRRTGDDAPSGGKTQQGGGVIAADAFSQLFHHSFIAAHFHILAGQDECQPHQRIEPVDAQSEERQCLNHMVTSADMVLLVKDDVFLFTVGKCGGQIDFRPNQPHHKGRVNVVGKMNVAPQAYGTHQSAPDPYQGGGAVNSHCPHSGQPDDHGNSKRIDGRCKTRIRDSLLQVLMFANRSMNSGDVGFCIRNINYILMHILQCGSVLCGIGSRSVQQTQQRELGCNGYRAQQSEQNHRPQCIGKKFWTAL